MKLVYKISVDLAPQNGKYFWVLQNLNIEANDGGWCTSSAGWADTYDDAWNQAKNFYEKYKINKE